MKILLIKSLFVPNNSYVQINLDSIRAFIKYLLTLNKIYTFIVEIVGWVNNADDKRMIINKINEYSQELENKNIIIQYEIWGENYGKTYLLSCRFIELRLLSLF